MDYRDVTIKPNSVIYLDPPYQGTCKYDFEINYDEFWFWCLEQKAPTYISSYAIPEKYQQDFTIVGEWLVKSTLQGGANKRVDHPTEKLFWNNKSL